jgi:hypothetical protein
MITYDDIKHLKNLDISLKVSIKVNYVVLTMQDVNDYHITIYEEQWDYYSDLTGFKYYLFHISSNNMDNRCSTYFWVDIENLDIIDIPPRYFKYDQSNFDMYASTRSKCITTSSITKLKDIFNKTLLFLSKNK